MRADDRPKDAAAILRDRAAGLDAEAMTLETEAQAADLPEHARVYRAEKARHNRREAARLRTLADRDPAGAFLPTTE